MGASAVCAEHATGASACLFIRRAQNAYRVLVLVVYAKIVRGTTKTTRADYMAHVVYTRTKSVASSTNLAVMS